MKTKEFAIGSLLSTAAVIFVSSWLLPGVPLWKTAVVCLTPFFIFLAFWKYKTSTPDPSIEPGINAESGLLNHLLENINDENWGDAREDFTTLQKTNPSLVAQLVKLHRAYLANKQFTQNATHELQTPMAVVKGQAELLLQAPSLSEKQAEAIGAILRNINRLSRLISALILLTKIENDRYADEERVNLTEILSDVLSNFNDMIELHGLSIEQIEADPFKARMSATLAEILVANLLQNAIRHNIPQGFIKIISHDNQLTISNSGKPLDTLPDNLFKRFYRESKAEESLGLGLSIVKRIVEQSGLEIKYGYLEGVHSVSLMRKG